MWRPLAAVRRPLALGRGRLGGRGTWGAGNSTRSCRLAKDMHVCEENQEAVSRGLEPHAPRVCSLRVSSAARMGRRRPGGAWGYAPAGDARGGGPAGRALGWATSPGREEPPQPVCCPPASIAYRDG